MKTVKKYINKQIMTIVGDLIEKREEMDIVINFNAYEDDFTLAIVKKRLRLERWMRF